MKAKAYMGIDPGVKGSICVLTEDQTIFYDYHEGIVDDIRDISLKYDVQMCTVETQFVIPSQGGFTAFKIGVGYGGYLWALRALMVPRQTVRAQLWQGEFNLPKGNPGMTKAQKRKLRKQCLIDIACGMNPDADIETRKFEKTSGRADAYLIARFGGLK